MTPDIPPTAQLHDAVVNAQPGTVVTDGGVAVMVIAYDVVDDRIAGVRVVSNPDKLTALHGRRAADEPPELRGGGARLSGRPAGEDPPAGL